MNVEGQSQQPALAPNVNGSCERSMRKRLLEALKSHHPKPLGADRLCALAGVRRILLATAMSELITSDEAHLVCADVYGFGPIAPTARSLGKKLDTSRLVEKTCRRCAVSKMPTEFYTGDSTCKECRKQLAKAKKTSSPTADCARRCKCGAVCQYYGAVGGYSVQCEACNARDAARRRQGAGKESQPEVPADSRAERAQPPEAIGGTESAPTVPHVVADKESQPVPPLTDGALHIPPRKGLDCCVRGGMVILTQGESSIEIDVELCDAVAGWLMCASDGNSP